MPFLPPIDPALRKQAVDRMLAGEKARDVAQSLNLNEKTVAKWWQKENPDPKGIPPPHRGPGRPKKDKPAAYKASGGRRPITEQTAGLLVAGLFTVAAILDTEEIWLLNQTERDGMAGSLADSMRALPTGVADAINTYSAPVTFFSALATVIAHKIKLRNEAKRKKKFELGAIAPPAREGGPLGPGPTFRSVPPRTVPFTAPPVPPAAPAPSGNGVGGPFTERPESSLAEAIDAARGNLTELDPRDEAEDHFS